MSRKIRNIEVRMRDLVPIIAKPITLHRFLVIGSKVTSRTCALQNFIWEEGGTCSHILENGNNKYIGISSNIDISRLVQCLQYNINIRVSIGVVKRWRNHGILSKNQDEV